MLLLLRDFVLVIVVLGLYIPEVGVVVQVEHVEGFLPLGEMLRLQEL